MNHHEIIYQCINHEKFQRKQHLQNRKIIEKTKKSLLYSYDVKYIDHKITVKKVKFEKTFSKLFFNYFFIGHNVLNRIRKRIPHFLFTYKYELQNAELQNPKQYLFLEYIKGVTMKEFLLHEEPNSILFQNLVLQLLCALQMIQDKYHYTHYDLHLKNIIVCPVNHEKNFRYQILNREVIVENLGYTIVLIDYEYSVATKYRRKIFYLPELMKFGYIGVFFSGQDILRFFFCLKKLLLCYEKKNIHCFHYLSSFVDYIFEHFFHIQFNPKDVTSFKKHNEIFFSMIHTRQIYRTPVELLVFLESNRQELNLSYDQMFPTFLQPRIQLYIPTVFSSKEAILLFIHQHEKTDKKTQNELDKLYLARIVVTLKDVLKIHEKIQKNHIIHEIKYLQS